MTDKEIEKALKDRAYEISYGDHNDSDKWIVPKDKLSQETLAYIDRLKEVCQSAIRSFTRMETLYKLKCNELENSEAENKRFIDNMKNVLEIEKEQVRKDTAKEILQEIDEKCNDLIADNSPESLDFLDFARDTLLTELCNKYGIKYSIDNGVEVDDE